MIRRKQIELKVLRLPTRKVPEPWKSTLHKTATPNLILFPDDPALQKHLDLSSEDWWVTLWWVIKKKWDKRLKYPPVKNKYVKSLETRGELFFRTLELCIACHQQHPESRQIYPDPASWYLGILEEAKHLEDQAILENEPMGKTPFIRSRRDIIRSLKTTSRKQRKNPADPETSPHYHRLIEAAYQLDRKDAFVEEYWQPYLDAISGWIQRLDTKECQEWFVEGERLVRRVGKGRAKIPVFTAPCKK